VSTETMNAVAVRSSNWLGVAAEKTLRKPGWSGAVGIPRECGRYMGSRDRNRRVGRPDVRATLHVGRSARRHYFSVAGGVGGRGRRFAENEKLTCSVPSGGATEPKL